MLKITNLNVQLNQQQDNKQKTRTLLHGLNLTVNAGEIHAVMGPNGSGKSTLGNVLAGRDGYEVTEGNVEFMGQNLLELIAEERAVAGLFLGFQHPVVIPGLNNMYFLKAALNALRKKRGENELDAMDFLNLVRGKLSVAGLDEGFLYRSLNDGFSGGEKKRNEILQMLILEPKLAILDEIDSGLDIDSLQTVAAAINSMRNDARSVILVTHYQRLLHYVVPDFVHVLINGRIVRSGDKSLAFLLEERGYGWLE